MSATKLNYVLNFVDEGKGIRYVPMTEDSELISTEFLGNYNCADRIFIP